MAHAWSLIGARSCSISNLEPSPMPHTHHGPACASKSHGLCRGRRTCCSWSCLLSQHEDSLFKSPSGGYPGAERPLSLQDRLNQTFYELSFFLSLYNFCSKLNFPGSFHWASYDMILTSFVVLVNLTVKVSKKTQTQLHLCGCHHWLLNVLSEFGRVGSEVCDEYGGGQGKGKW